jgi:hypothetical protein
MRDTITKEYYKENLEWWHYRDRSIGVIKLPIDTSIELILPDTLDHLHINMNRGEARLYSGGDVFSEQTIKEAEEISYKNMYEKRIPESYIDKLVKHINILILESNEDFKS